MWETALNLHLANWPAVILAVVPLLVTTGLFVYAQRYLPRDSRTLLLELFLFGILGWQTFDVMVRLSATVETAVFWRGLLRFGQIFTLPVGLHFALHYTQARLGNNRAFLVGLYGYTFLLFGFFQNGVIVENLQYHPGWGYLANSAEFPLIAMVVVNGAASMALATSVVLIGHARRVRGIPGEGQAALLMAVGHSLPALGGVFTEVVMPTFLGIHQWPITGSTVTFFGVCAAIALTRFNMFSVSTPAAAKAMLETITDPMFIARADGYLLYANTQALTVFGINDDRIQAYHLGTLFPSDGDALAFFAGRWKDTLSGQRFTGLDAYFRDSEGDVIPYLVSLAPIPITRQGEPGVALVAHNVQRLKAIESDLVLARDQAEEANRAKSMFLANMSHELRTPLNAVIGYAEMLEEDVEDPTVAQDLGRIHQSGRYLLTLINDILDLAKVESGKLRVRCDSFPLSEVLDVLDPAAQQMATLNGNSWRMELPPELQPVRADQVRVRQVLLNLISNAAKFTENGTFGLTVEQQGPTTRFKVWDSGIGMNEQQLSKLFGSFSQVHQSNHGKYGGTGLGLALSRSLCQLMDGDIDVSSAPGEGTTFTVTLPTG